MTTRKSSRDGGASLSLLHGERDLTADDVWREIAKLLDELMPRVELTEEALVLQSLQGTARFTVMLADRGRR